MGLAEKANEEKELIKEIVKDKTITIGDIDFKMANIVHRDGLVLSSYYIDIQSDMSRGKFSFIRDSEFEKIIYPIIERHTLVDGVQLSKIDRFWDDKPHAYYKFINYFMAAVAYPFFAASLTD